MIKYLGSKRLLIEPIMHLCAPYLESSRVIADCFTGTTRVAQEFKRRGKFVIANDSASYSREFAMTYIETDSRSVDLRGIEKAIHRLNEGHNCPCAEPGDFTDIYSRQSRFFSPENAAKIDLVRQDIDYMCGCFWPAEWKPILLTSLIEAADRVDATVGVQMAYLKILPPRALNRLALRMPQLLVGKGGAACDDAAEFARSLAGMNPSFHPDLAYLDPPYNQHSYLGNYHLWETLALWDDPDVYGIACKRTDVKTRKSPWNSKVGAARAFTELIEALAFIPRLLLSFNDEGFLALDFLESVLSYAGYTSTVVSVPHPRYVGSKIGIYNPGGEKVGVPGETHNHEYLIYGERKLAWGFESALAAA